MFQRSQQCIAHRLPTVEFFCLTIQIMDLLKLEGTFFFHTFPRPILTGIMMLKAMCPVRQGFILSSSASSDVSQPLPMGQKHGSPVSGNNSNLKFKLYNIYFPQHRIFLGERSSLGLVLDTSQPVLRRLRRISGAVELLRQVLFNPLAQGDLYHLKSNFLTKL